jgi:arylformamidase
MPQEAVPQQHRAKGPRVFLDYTQAELDCAYDQNVYAPNRQQLNDRRASLSAEVRARIGAPLRLAYGPTAIEKLDIYKSSRPSAPIFVFIHGGAWRNGVARDHADAAEMFVAAGAHCVVPDFVLVQDAGASLFPMADQVRRAIAWVYQHAAEFGGDANRLHLGGHSSGAHLSACALTTDWQGEFGLPPDMIKTGLCCSGMYDLLPVSLSARSEYVKFTPEMIEALSPLRHLDRLHAPIVVAHGTLETPEFQRQARDFAAAVKAAGKPVELLVGQHYNHFEMGETLANPFGLIGRAALQQMGIGFRPA